MKPISNTNPFSIGNYVLVTKGKWKGERKIINMVPCFYANADFAFGCAPVTKLGGCQAGGKWLVLELSPAEQATVVLVDRYISQGDGIAFCCRCL
jgi:hypothetical protein